MTYADNGVSQCSTISFQNMAISFLFFYLLFTLQFHSVWSAATQQQGAMCDLVAAFNFGRYYNWECDTDGVPSTDVCTWQQVGCDSESVVISLGGFSDDDFLYGTIPTTIGELTGLSYFNISDAYLWSGDDIIPSTIGSLTNLQVFAFHKVGLEAPLPTTMGLLTNLQILDMSDNYLNDQLPTFIGELVSLQVLDISKNYFTGTIPTEIGYLSNLQILDMNYVYRLSGSIPTAIGQLTDLQVFDLSGSNRISGALPSEMGLLSSLQILEISNNYYMTGSLPSSLCSLHKLTYLDVSLCIDMAGPFPECIGNLTNLVEMYLDYNRLSGTLPSTIGYMSKLEIFNISHNYYMTGSIPDSIGMLEQLISLDFGYCRLNNEIPSTMGNITTLQSMNLISNSFSGTLPASLGKLVNLIDMSIENQITGPIPDSFCNMTSLTSITLSNDVWCQPPCLEEMGVVVSGGGRVNCNTCPGGTHVIEGVYGGCASCSDNTYQVADNNSTQCITCPIGNPSGGTGKSECAYYIWVTNWDTITVVLAMISVMYVLAFAAAGRKWFAIIVNMAPSALDHITDTLYVMNEPFYNHSMFVASAFFLVAPCLVFAYDIYSTSDFPVIAQPCPIFWLGIKNWKPTRSGTPVLDGHACSFCCWPILLVFQVFSFPFLVCWSFFIAPILLVLWFVVGSFLYNSRTLAIGRVRRLWYYIWKGGVDTIGVEIPPVDTAVLNQSLFSGFILEDLPQLIIQITNGALVGWSVISQLSIAMTLYMTMSGLYTFLYYMRVYDDSWW